MVRLYMPGRPALVYQQVNRPLDSKANGINISDIEDLMVGVHLAVISEAMSFCEHLGIDPDLMFDIVSNAAGASTMFIKAFADMRNAAWSLKAVKGVEEISHRLVSS